jgi:ribosomal protein L30E
MHEVTIITYKGDVIAWGDVCIHDYQLQSLLTIDPLFYETLLQEQAN